jgi:mannose-6-phosphate isomerase
MEQGLYPLKFMPLFKDKIWGGNKIRDIVGIDYSPLNRCGELWVLEQHRRRRNSSRKRFS